MKTFFTGLLVALVFFGAMLITRGILSIDRPISRSDYLQAVRAKNPDNPELFVCLYGHLIDERGTSGAKAFDIKYASGTVELSDADAEMVSRALYLCTGK